MTNIVPIAATRSAEVCAIVAPIRQRSNRKSKPYGRIVDLIASWIQSAVACTTCGECSTKYAVKTILAANTTLALPLPNNE